MKETKQKQSKEATTTKTDEWMWKASRKSFSQLYTVSVSFEIL